MVFNTFLNVKFVEVSLESVCKLAGKRNIR